MKYIIGKGHFNDGKEYYNVEKIITRKFDVKKKLYLIKWDGYPLQDCSWEPISHLENIGDMVEIFDKNFPNSIDKKRLRRYLNIIKKKESNIIRIRNPFMDKKRFKKRKIKKNNNIIISIDNSRYVNTLDKEKKEEIKVIEKEIEETSIKVDDIVNGTEKLNLDLSEKISELSTINSDEKYPKLIRPILIW